MTNNPSTNATDASQVDTSSSPQPQAGNSQAQAASDSQASQNVSHDELQRQIAELRRENAAHRRKNKEQEDAAAQAEQARLAEQGQFKQLAEQHQARVRELEPIAESYTRLAEQIKQQILQDTKDWPAEVKAFYPGDHATAEQLQDWYNRSKPLLEKLQQQARGQQAGNRANPPVAGQPQNKAERMEANRQAFIRQRNYGL
jgi:hypothetical protein